MSYKELFNDFINEEFSIKDDFTIINKILKSIDSSGNSKLQKQVATIRIHLNNIRRELNRLNKEVSENEDDLLDEMSSMGGGAVEGSSGNWKGKAKINTKPYGENK